MSTAKEYRLGSSPMVYAPGIVAWAINGYAFKRDRKAMLNVLTSGWNLPAEVAKALLSKAVAYVVEGEAVVFSYPGEAVDTRSDFQKTGKLYPKIDLAYFVEAERYWQYAGTTQQYKTCKAAKAAYCARNGADPSKVRANKA